MDLQKYITGPVGILGYGVEGRSTCRFLLSRGAKEIVVYDRNAPESLPDGAVYGGNENRLAASPKDILVLFRSAGIRPDIPAVSAFKETGGLLTSQTELFMELAPSERTIGVTGTLGKGTCCTLLHDMLRAGGQRVCLGGNIGTPALDILDDVVTGGAMAVLELSSFQLSTMKRSPPLAAVLKTTVEHLDWHTSQEEYWRHKSGLVRHQDALGITVFCADAEGSRVIAKTSGGITLGYGKNGPDIYISDEGCRWPDFAVLRKDLEMPGIFNLENIAAAGTLAKLAGVPVDAIITAACSFKGLEHRLENAGSRGGLTFYNDSYATRPEAAIGALESFPDTNIGIILGGSEKNIDFSELAGVIASHDNVRAVALIGSTAGRLKECLEKAGALENAALALCSGLEDSIAFLMKHISEGVILLSPACASFGLFANYKERGKKFKELVHKICRAEGNFPLST